MTGSRGISLSLICELERYSDDVASREEIVILDHGCGGAFTLFYLAALGYTNIYGVDIEDRNYEQLNLISHHCLGLENKRFVVYDGTKLALADNSIDIVYSQTVLEHVSPAQFDGFFSEEYRVLKYGGIMLHDIPHRLGPYDSHTRTWLLHWMLPPALWLRTLKMVGRVPGVYIFLRWPGVHRRAAKRCFGNVTDRSFHRIRGMSLIPYKAYPSEPGLTTCWVCGCHRRNVRLMFCDAQPLEVRPPDVPRRLRGALSR